MKPSHRTARADDLVRFGAAVFAAHGATAADAQVVAGELVQASLLGHDSHGILRIGRYVEKIERRTLEPAAQPRIARRQGAIAAVDGGFGFGPVTARFGAGLALELARAHGIGAVSLGRTNHVGRLGGYAEQISSAGFIGLIFASGAGPGGSVAPHGGRERIFGTNPLAWGLPVPPPRGPLVADFATSAVPEGKLSMAQSRGEPAPPGALLDREGRPTTDPAAFYAGGALLPFGGHKGSSLLLFIELVASVLAGSVPSSSSAYQPGNPVLMIALSVDAFVPREEYLKHTEELLRRIESSRPAEGFSEVLLPNALELKTEAVRRRDGIPIPEPIWQEFVKLAGATGAALPS